MVGARAVRPNQRAAHHRRPIERYFKLLACRQLLLHRLGKAEEQKVGKVSVCVCREEMGGGDRGKAKISSFARKARAHPRLG